ncbi:MAG: cytidylyltransferase domain-containing protein [Gammaproteobacteria bacterium]
MEIQAATLNFNLLLAGAKPTGDKLMIIFAIVPARSGSKGLPDKNILTIAGKPLLAYSIEFAKKIKVIDRVFCSTDSAGYAQVAREYGAEAPFLRSPSAATDNAMEQDILVDLREKFKAHGIAEPDLVVWLRPTFVFRKPGDVLACIETLVGDASFTSARTVVPTENRLYTVVNGLLIPDFEDQGQSMVRRQDMPTSFKVFSADVFRFKDNDFGPDFLGRKVAAIETAQLCGLDIDTQQEFEIVKFMVEQTPGEVHEYL